MNQKPRPYVLAETNWKKLKDVTYNVAVLPWGATEAHNYHLPYGTDTFQADYVSIESAKNAWDKNAKVIVLPSISYGVNTGQMDIKLCMNMNPSTQYMVLKDLVQVLNIHNIQKLVIINGHGGNNFKQFIRELSLEFPKVFICSIDWWKAGDASTYFDEPGDHAGELETSVMTHLHPNLILPLIEAGVGATKKFRIDALNESWVTSQREWSQISKDTGVGNPKLASKEKGQNFLNHITNTIGNFLFELNNSDNSNMYS